MDVERVYNLVNSNLDAYFAPDVVNFFLMQWPGGQFIAEDFLGNPVGVICGSRLDGGRASIALFAVDARHRGTGVGTQLLQHFRRRCLMEGLTRIQLEVRTTNIRAISFYERNGFVRTEYLRGFYDGVGDAYRMLLSINGVNLGLPSSEGVS